MVNKSSLATLIIITFLVTQISAQYASKSVLAEGDIYKMSISQTGLYKLTYDQIKANTDIAVDQIDPNNIHIYGNNGGLLPLANETERADDLRENSIYVEGDADNNFNPGDYILFYAEGPNRINKEGSKLTYEKNIYDLNNYYFLEINDTPGKRVEIGPTITSSEYLDYTEKLLRHEEDKLNLLGSFGSTQGSGKQWFGETFTNNRSQDFSSSFRINAPDGNSEATVEMLFAARSEVTSTVELSVNGKIISGSLGTSAFGQDALESIYAKTTRLSETIDLSSNPSVTVNYQGNSSTNTEAWLDFIQIIAREKIVVGSSPVELYNSRDLSTVTSGYRFISNGGNINIWNITDTGNITTPGFSEERGEISFGYETNNQINSFIAFDSNGDFLSPNFMGKIANQNIHGIERIDFAIITHPNFRETAEKLANHRRTNDNLVVEIINIFDVYNEFAGGKADPVAIRDMSRMLKSRDDNFRYLVLLGDATYDYRGLVPGLPNHNFVPTYQTDQSLSPVNAFPSDDYFGLLSDDEGDNLQGELELGIGRIPAATVDEAEAVVNKIIHYDTNPNRYGDWRTRVGFAADDVDKSWDSVHMKDSEKISKKVDAIAPCLLQQKVYFDAFKQEATPGGARYPTANKAINDNIFKGQLVFNYLGHGGPKGLSQERVIQIPDIRAYSNMDKLTVFITATCSFTGFDEPNFVSAGEHLILNPNGGAVAVFTTVRSVYASQNFDLADEIFETIFDRTDGQATRLGDIIVKSKNTGNSTNRENTRKFLLMGDPSMRIALPQHDIRLTHFNDEQLVAGQQDTIGALGRGQYKGEIVSHIDSTLISNFNGEVAITVYDKISTLSTLVNDGQGAPIPFNVKKNILYKGVATVTNGTFDLSLILPVDIDYNLGAGSIHMYADDGVSSDAAGCYGNLVIGGSSSSVIEDNEGPDITIFMDDRSFVIGGETTKEPLLIVDLADENGINLSSTSIGHDITATLEDPNGDKIILNDFYKPTINKIGEGTVTYQMGELEPGPHKLYLKAWDILNNSSEAVTDFVVTATADGTISQVYNYPNPFSTSTEFMFDHDLVNSQLDMVVNIYTVSGKLVKSIVDSRFASGRSMRGIAWNGKDDYGNKLAKGIYLYKIIITAPELNQSRESDFQKLVVLN